jgi:hypothetical protein
MIKRYYTSSLLVATLFQYVLTLLSLWSSRDSQFLRFGVPIPIFTFRTFGSGTLPEDLGLKFHFVGLLIDIISLVLVSAAISVVIFKFNRGAAQPGGAADANSGRR